MNLKQTTIAAAIALTTLAAVSCKKKSSEADILEFWVSGIQYTISGTSIVHIYPKSAPDTWATLPSMPVEPSKVVISKGAKIAPSATQKQDFEKGVTYTVTSSDGTRKTYTVKAERVMEYVE